MGLLATIAIVGSALSGVTGAVAAEQQAQATQSAANYQAQVAANNQKIAQQSAQQAAAAGSAQVEQAGIKEKAEIGSIKAAQAASNVDVDTGSAVDVRSSAAELGQLDALTIRSNTAKQVYGYETQASGFAGQEQLAKSEAASAGEAGDIGAFGSLLSGATGAASKYLMWSNLAGTGAGAGTGGPSLTALQGSF